jgi:hypothetical protein
MSTKKKLIHRMALWTAAALGLGLLALGGALLLVEGDRRRFEDNQAAERAQLADRSRKYVAELAKRIDRLPVDPTLVAEVESRYFEEQASGPMQVWAMGTGGEFLFGVPREAFSRLNAVYDREITPRLKEGVFLDRQAFFLGQLDGGEDLADLVLAGEAADESGPVADVVERLRRYAGRSDGAVVLSAPLRSADGAALGSLYLKRTRPEREWFRPDDRLQMAAGGAGGVAALAFAFLWVLLPTWVYVDARERAVRRAFLFAFLTVLSSLVGLVVYLIARPEDGKTLACPGCAREVNGGAFCPHCGRDLSAAFCPTCRYPLKPDWAFCPSCRTEIRPGAPLAARAAEAPPAV